MPRVLPCFDDATFRSAKTEAYLHHWKTIDTVASQSDSNAALFDHLDDAGLICF